MTTRALFAGIMLSKTCGLPRRSAAAMITDAGNGGCMAILSVVGIVVLRPN
ncbi:MAG: hypothetical protein PSV22_13825 [Pseudolabrys sp.]|nr:hypothetical protein [Pseudolabrys sp.]